jgi:hypothetical protein
MWSEPERETRASMPLERIPRSIPDAAIASLVP